METSQATISRKDVKEMLEATVPELKIESSTECNLTKLIDGFARYTIDLMKTGNISAIKNCFNAAEQMLAEGSGEVKSAIENIYVFAVTTFFDMAHAVSKQVKDLLPEHLMEEYHRQISSSTP